MKIEEMAVPNAFKITPEVFSDERGASYEPFRADAISAATGTRFRVAQGYCSVSRRNTIRGIHGTTLPPGQEKLITCVRGAVLDAVVDIRAGSPTFGRFDMVRLDEKSRVSVYLSEGLGHAFCALTDDACVSYLLSAQYVPGTMIEADALDPEIGLPWGLDTTPLRSAKDARAPTIAELASAGRLPTYEQCMSLLRAGRPRRGPEL